MEGENDAILITNLNPTIKEEAIKAFFDKVGEVQKVTFLGNSALVYFEDPGSTDTALMFDSADIAGEKISVKSVNSREYLASQPEIIAQSTSDDEKKRRDSDEQRRRKESEDRKLNELEERRRKDSEERKNRENEERRRKNSEERRAQESEERQIRENEERRRRDSEERKRKNSAERKEREALLKKNTFEEKKPELVTAQNERVEEESFQSSVTSEVPIATRKTNVQRNVGLGYNDIKSLLQSTNVPARERLSDGDLFKETIGNRAYLLGTVAAWSVVWVLSNMFL